MMRNRPGRRHSRRHRLMSEYTVPAGDIPTALFNKRTKNASGMLRKDLVPAVYFKPLRKPNWYERSGITIVWKELLGWALLALLWLILRDQGILAMDFDLTPIEYVYGFAIGGYYVATYSATKSRAKEQFRQFDALAGSVTSLADTFAANIDVETAEQLRTKKLAQRVYRGGVTRTTPSEIHGSDLVIDSAFALAATLYATEFSFVEGGVDPDQLPIPSDTVNGGAMLIELKQKNSSSFNGYAGNLLAIVQRNGIQLSKAEIFSNEIEGALQGNVDGANNALVAIGNAVNLKGTIYSDNILQWAVLITSTFLPLGFDFSWHLFGHDVSILANLLYGLAVAYILYAPLRLRSKEADVFDPTNIFAAESIRKRPHEPAMYILTTMMSALDGVGHDENATNNLNTTSSAAASSTPRPAAEPARMFAPSNKME